MWNDEVIIRLEIVLPNGQHYAYDQRVSMREFGDALAPLPPMHDLPDVGIAMPDMFNRVASEQQSRAEHIKQERKRFGAMMHNVLDGLLGYSFAQRDPVRGRVPEQSQQVPTS